MNPCLRRFGLPALRACYNAMDANGLPTVSVASGTGSVEAAIQHPARPIFCVDPEPNSFQPHDPRNADLNVRIDPHAASCANLVADHPTLVGSCNLMLNWPEGDAVGRYDIDAIARLRPARILLLIESTGGSGSDALYAFLNANVRGWRPVERDGGWVLPYDGEMSNLPKYTVVQSAVHRVETGGSYGSRNYRMVYCVGCSGASIRRSPRGVSQTCVVEGLWPLDEKTKQKKRIYKKIIK